MSLLAFFFFFFSSATTTAGSLPPLPPSLSPRAAKRAAALLLLFADFFLDALKGTARGGHVSGARTGGEEGCCRLAALCRLLLGCLEGEEGASSSGEGNRVSGDHRAKLPPGCSLQHSSWRP